MILPIYVYGHPLLRKTAKEIDAATYPNLKELIDNMYETMYSADGVGLAAPQVGLEDRIFVVDLEPLADNEHPEFKSFKKVFINAEITEKTGELEWVEEGCLSIQGIHKSAGSPEKSRAGMKKCRVKKESAFNISMKICSRTMKNTPVIWLVLSSTNTIISTESCLPTVFPRCANE